MPTVYVAMSGGVDSSVAAALLKNGGFSANSGPASGWDVRGLFMRYWGDVDDIVPPGKDFTNCCNIEAMNDARAVCDHLGIPLSVMDLRTKFKDDVVKPFVSGYESGLTPNPCIECNRSIKFELIDRILSEAAEEEKDDIFFATGHYIRTTNRHAGNDQHPIGFWSSQNDGGAMIRMFAAADARKDQSYFLYTLTQEKLRHLLFPIGDYTKSQVRELAAQMSLPVANKKESQEVCFVKHTVQEFLASRLRSATPGDVVDTAGKRIGTHRGLPFYTLGQREGLHLGGGGGPYYVAEKNFDTNTLVVAKGEDDPKLFQQCVLLKNVNWISGTPPDEPIRVIAKPRYRHLGAAATVTVNTFYSLQRTARCVFDLPERALTPGQSVVFYKDTSDGFELLGGGTIADVDRSNMAAKRIWGQ